MNSPSLTSIYFKLKSLRTHPFWGKVLRITGLWLLFSFLYASFAVCPFCGTPGCPVGAGSAGVVGGIMTFLMKFFERARSVVKYFFHNKLHKKRQQTAVVDGPNPVSNWQAKITVICDDRNCAMPGFKKCYGFSALIELSNKKILFDAGTNSKKLIANLHLLGVDPQYLDGIILSHNHYDHTDGLSGLLKINPTVPVYVHKNWDDSTLHKGYQVPKENRVTIASGRVLSELHPDILITSAFYSPDYNGIHEQAVFVRTRNEHVLICGCSHPGLLPFLQERRTLGIDDTNHVTIIGGFHGTLFSDKEAQEIDPLLQAMTLFHCTKHGKALKKLFGDKCIDGIVGKTLVL